MPGLGKNLAKMLVRTYQRCRIMLRVPTEQRIGALNGNYKYVYSNAWINIIYAVKIMDILCLEWKMITKVSPVYRTC